MNWDLPEELEHIITRLLEKDRELRYQTATDLRADLKRLQRDLEPQREVVARAAEAVRTSASASASPAQVISRRFLMTLAVGLALLLAIGFAWYAWRRPGPPPHLDGA